MSMVSRYQKRISGPLMDRIDTLRDIEVPRVEYEKLSETRLGESSASTRRGARVAKAGERQQRRFAGSRLLANADTRALRAGASVGA